MKNITIPKEAIKYILFQRTAYLKVPNTKLYRILKNKNIFPTFLYNKIVEIEAWLFKGKIKGLYIDDMQSEFDSIKEYLPLDCHNILDIGCGMAGIDLFLSNFYKNVNVHLLDKNEVTGSVYYDFNNKAAFYNSLDLAELFLKKNHISESKINLLFANDENEINTDVKFDIVISLISWGFHYPVETYLDRVHEILNINGVLILDIRKGNNGLELIKEKFNKVDVVLDTNKFYRVRAIK